MIKRGPNVINRRAFGYPGERYGHHSRAGRCGGAGKRRRIKRWVFVLVFLLAVVCTSIPCAWLLNRYGAALQPSPANAYRVIAGAAQQPPPAAEAAAGNVAAPPAEYPPGGLPGEMPPAGAAVSGGLGVSLIYQNPELKNGCEAASLAMLLRYRGYPADKSILAYSYIPREDFRLAGGVRCGPHPGTAYPGDPATSKGFYCYPGPIITGANRFLAEQGESLQAHDISGADEEELIRELQEGHPVMLWLCMDYGTQPAYLDDFTWQLPDGKIYTPYGNLHCVVLSGFGSNAYQVCDPIGGTITVDRGVLFNSYQTMGGMAVVIK